MMGKRARWEGWGALWDRYRYLSRPASMVYPSTKPLFPTDPTRPPNAPDMRAAEVSLDQMSFRASSFEPKIPAEPGGRKLVKMKIKS
jgi:hypothetical protein